MGGITENPMPNFDRIDIMPHARKRLAERSVLEADATSTICDPEKRTFQYAGNRGGKVYLHSKRIGNGKLFVVAEIVGRQAYVITVFWEDARQP
jgi:hypothetical protein